MLGPAVVVLEVALPVLLWPRRTRRLAIAVGVAFHLGIAFVMDIRVFSYAMIATYLLFLDPDTVPRALARLGRAAVTAARFAGRREPSSA